MRQSGNNLLVFNLLAMACLPGNGGAQGAVKTRIAPITKSDLSSLKAVNSVGPSMSVDKANRGKPNIALGAGKSGAVNVMVRTAAQVAGRTFMLGEIADIKGGDAALRKRLEVVEIGASPLPGLSRQILSGDVIVHLRAAQCGDLLESKRISLITPPIIQISRVGQDVGMEMITKAAMAAVQPTIKELTGITLEPEMPAGRMTLPAGKIILLPGACQGQIEQGALHVPVSLIVDDKTVQTVDVTLKVHRRMAVVVARHGVEPHDILTADDIVLSTVELPTGFTRPIIDLQSAVGKRAVRRVSAGMPVSADALEIPPDIAANIRVTVSYAVGAITITLPGLTKQAGHIGETIRVYMQDTGKELEAAIVDAHTVRVIDGDDTGN